MSLHRTKSIARLLRLNKILDFLLLKSQKRTFYSIEEKRQYEAELRIQQAKSMLPPIFRV